ncbi:MAG: PEGA domain-containing protein [Polyangiaceae bacterium]
MIPITHFRRGGGRRRGLLTTVAFTLSLLAHVSSVHAQAQDPKVVARTKALDGTRIADEGQHARALELFQEAYGLYPEPAYLYDMGVEFQALGRDVEALDAYRRFLADPKGTPRSLVTHASELLADLDKRLGEIQLRGAPEGAEIAIDDEPRGAAPAREPLRAKPGPHRVLLRRAGFEPFRADVQVPEGGAAVVDVGLFSPSETAAPSTSAPRATTLAWSLTGGLGFWTAGPPAGADPSPTFSLAAGHPVVVLPGDIALQLGGKVGFTYFSEPLGTNSFVSLLANARFVKAIAPRISAFADVGAGVLILAGVPDGSSLFGANGGRPTGALSTFELRPALGASYAIAEGLAFHIAPAFVWNPSPSERFASASLTRFELGIGLSGEL